MAGTFWDLWTAEDYIFAFTEQDFEHLSELLLHALIGGVVSQIPIVRRFKRKQHLTFHRLLFAKDDAQDHHEPIEDGWIVVDDVGEKTSRISKETKHKDVRFQELSCVKA